MTYSSSRAELLDLLARRVGRDHAERRLAVEHGGEHPVFGRGRTFLHLENWVFSDKVIRTALKACFMHERGRRNALDVGVTENLVRLRALPSGFDGFRILQLSDLHLDMNDKFPKRLAEIVAPLEFDICVMTGDFRYRTYGPWTRTIDALRLVREKLSGPVYGVLGNHDTIRMLLDIENLDIQILVNESIALKRGDAEIWLAGIDDPHFFCTDDIGRARRDIPNDKVAVLLAHSPEIYRPAASAGFELMLCGHTHGGQIRLPGGIPLILNAKCPRAFCAGAWEYEGMQAYTSVGTGSSIVDVRFNCRPEVTIHTLKTA